VSVTAVQVPSGHYLGHVYAWPEGFGSETLGVIGIRRNIMDYLLNINRQTALVPILMKGIQYLALTGVGFGNVIKQEVRVEQPIGRMPTILSSCGFIESLGDYIAKPTDIKCASDSTSVEKECEGYAVSYYLH
jgi:hypothetical protein